MVSIPIDSRSSADFLLTSTVGGVQCEFRFRWNESYDYWTMGVRDVVGGKSIIGVRLITRFPLLFAHSALSPLPGDLMMIPTDPALFDTISFDGLGRDWFLVYLTPQEVEDWLSSEGL